MTAAGYAMTNSVSDRIAFATLVVGNAGLWWSTSTNRYTPPAGKYFLIFTGNVQAPVGGNGTATIFLRKNGAQVGGGVSGSGSASFTIPLTLGQYVDANGTDYFEWYSYAAVANMQFQGGTFSAFPLTGIQGPTGGAPGSVVGDFYGGAQHLHDVGSTPPSLPFNTVVNGNSGRLLQHERLVATRRLLVVICCGPLATYSPLLLLDRPPFNSKRMAFSLIPRHSDIWWQLGQLRSRRKPWLTLTALTILRCSGLAGNSAQFYVAYFLAYPTQGMVGPPGPAGPPGQIGWRRSQPGRDVCRWSTSLDIPSDVNRLQVFFDLTPGARTIDLVLAFYNGSGVLDTRPATTCWAAARPATRWRLAVLAHRLRQPSSSTAPLSP